METSSEVIIPLDAAGVARYSTLSIPFDAAAESVWVERAELHPVRPGRRVALAAVTERPRAGLAAAGRLESNFREYILAFPGLEIGDTLYIATRRSVSRLPFLEAFSYSFYRQSADSIASSSFTVEWPAGEPLHWTEGGGAPTESVSGGMRRLRWTWGPMPPLERLPLGVPVESEAARLVVAECTPSQLGRALYEVLDPGPVQPGDSILLAGLSQGAGTTPDSLRAWVAVNIAYLGSSLGNDPGYTPRSALETLTDGCGVCRDKSVLLTALLRLHGYEAWLGLTRTSHPLAELCGTRDFDHMVVLLEGSDGLEVLDPSTPAHAGPHGSALRGLPVLPVAPWCDGFVTVPFDAGTDTILISLALDGPLSSDSMAGWLDAGLSGAADELWRDMLGRVGRERWPELQEALFGLLPGSDLEVTGDPADPLSALGVSGRAVTPLRSVPWMGDTAFLMPGLVDLDRVGSRLAALVMSRASDGRPGGADTPLLEILHARLPLGGRAVELPEPFETDGYSISFRLEGDTLVWTETCDLGPWPAGVLAGRALERSATGRRIVVVRGGPR